MEAEEPRTEKWDLHSHSTRHERSAEHFKPPHRPLLSPSSPLLQLRAPDTAANGRNIAKVLISLAVVAIGLPTLAMRESFRMAAPVIYLLLRMRNIAKKEERVQVLRSRESIIHGIVTVGAKNATATAASIDAPLHRDVPQQRKGRDLGRPAFLVVSVLLVIALAAAAMTQVAKDEPTFITLMNWGIWLSLLIFMYYFHIQIPTNGSRAIWWCKGVAVTAAAAKLALAIHASLVPRDVPGPVHKVTVCIAITIVSCKDVAEIIQEWNLAASKDGVSALQDWLNRLPRHATMFTGSAIIIATIIGNTVGPGKGCKWSTTPSSV